MKEKNSSIPIDNKGSDDFYYILVDGLITLGPRIDADDQVLKEFFDGVETYNNEHGEDTVRVVGPKPKFKNQGL